jgi:hypothetical protein
MTHRTRSLHTICLLIPVSAFLTLHANAESREVISFALPIKCQIGQDCFFQNYVDHDISDKAHDYRCGGRTYNGHDGTDIRIPNGELQRKGFEVLAAAPGRVRAVRNDMDDVSVRKLGRAAITGKECGNGAVIEHDNGWSTQYCHMAKGSLRIKVGDRTATGQPIGLVGLSGDTEFFHLHFTVRHEGEVVDPFAYGAATNSCGGGRSLWVASIHEQIEYRAREMLDFGFTDIVPTMDMIESGEITKHPANSSSVALVAYIRAIGLQTGDRQILTLYSPAGAALAEYSPSTLDRDKAQSFITTGRKRKEAPWPSGKYTATYRVVSDGREVLRKTFNLEINF